VTYELPFTALPVMPVEGVSVGRSHKAEINVKPWSLSLSHWNLCFCRPLPTHLQMYGQMWLFVQCQGLGTIIKISLDPSIFRSCFQLLRRSRTPPLGGAVSDPIKRWWRPLRRQLSSSYVCEYIRPIEIKPLNYLRSLVTTKWCGRDFSGTAL
jgi:hypothetical protein